MRSQKKLQQIQRRVPRKREHEGKKNLQVSDLLQRFEQVSDGGFANDRMLLS